jgi:acyl dehydratase
LGVTPRSRRVLTRAECHIENQTFDEIAIGATASLTRTLTWDDIRLFAVMSGDINPAHLDPAFAESDSFHKIIAHGMWGGALISTVLGTKLPGPGTIYLGQTLRFKRPAALGDTITVTATAVDKDVERRRITFDCQCVNQHGEVVIILAGKGFVLSGLAKQVEVFGHQGCDLLRVGREIGQ